MYVSIVEVGTNTEKDILKQSDDRRVDRHWKAGSRNTRSIDGCRTTNTRSFDRWIDRAHLSLAPRAVHYFARFIGTILDKKVAHVTDYEAVRQAAEL